MHTPKLSGQGENQIFVELEIKELELDLANKQQQILRFEQLVQSKLNTQLLEIRKLEQLYKAEKKAKKAKRSLQKNKGKEINLPIQPKMANATIKTPESSDELKKLYKEAIQLVHPDKFMNDAEQVDKASEITTELISIYKSGDLKTLKDFHEYIIFGNPFQVAKEQDNNRLENIPKIDYLLKKRDKLAQELAELLNSDLYQILLSVTDETAFIDDLRIQFDERILTLLKRTRKSRK